MYGPRQKGLVPSISHEAIPKRTNESCLLRKTHHTEPSFATTLISLCGQVTKLHPSPYHAQRRGHIYGISSTTNAPSALHEGRSVLRTARWERIRTPTSVTRDPTRITTARRLSGFSSKVSRKFLHLLSGTLASDGWTLGSSGLGEGSSKDTRFGFTSTLNEKILPKLYRSPEPR